MKTKIEGILLSKVPYGDRHIIGKLLLRSGKKISVLFYGGQGGGSKKKSSILELGHMLQIELGHSRSTEHMYRAKETTLLWAHEKIRLNHKAFYLTCFYLEMLSKLALEDDLHDEHGEFDQSSAGHFRVLSNALFYLDQQLKKSCFSELDQVFIFLTKLSIETGVFPDVKHCALSGEELSKIENVILLSEQGGFADLTCINLEDQQHYFLQGKDLSRWMRYISTSKYGEIEELGIPSTSHVRALLSFLCFQYQFQESDFKSLALFL